MDKRISLAKLYFIFFKIGAILLGGGYVILPILISELCNKRNLVDESELTDYFALSQSLPGIVAVNISMFIGYKLRGKTGAIVTMLGIITVPFLIIALLVAALETLVNNRYVNGIFWGVGFAVIALIFLTAREVWQKTDKNILFYVIFLLSLFSLVILKMSAVNVIILFTVIGVLVKRFTRRRKI